MDRNPAPSEKGKNKIPEKGRIRLIIVLVAVVVAQLVITFQKEENPYDLPQVTEDSDTPAPEAAKKAKKKKKKKSLFTGSPKKMSYADLKISLAEDPLNFNKVVDTVTWKRRNIIRYLSIDTALQRMTNSYMKQYHPKYGSAVVVQPRTGRVLSMVSYNNPNEKSLGQKLYGSAYFPAASIMKTVTAAAVIEKNNFHKKSLLVTSGKNHTLYKSQLLKNPKRSHKITLGEGFAYSVNPLFGRLGIYHSGENTLHKHAQKFGFNEPIPFELPLDISQFQMPADEYELAEIASGFNQKTTLTPMLGALMAASISNHGKMLKPTLVDSIIDVKSGKKIYEAKAGLWRITTTKESAKELVSLMQGVVQYGTARTAFQYIKKSKRFNDFVYGGKTGSVDKENIGRADWFVGFLKDSTKVDEDLACAVLTVHGKKWTVHSSTIGAEIMRKKIMAVQKEKKKIAEAAKKEEKEKTDG